MVYIALYAGSREAKQVNNPIYEGQLYENVEEQQSSHLPPISSVDYIRNRDSISSPENIYQTSPINISTGQGIGRGSVGQEESSLTGCRDGRDPQGCGGREGEGEEKDWDVYYHEKSNWNKHHSLS